jgi:hypothetical protein
MKDDVNLAKLSVLLNSAVRMNTSNKGVRTEAYKNTMKTIQNSLPVCRSSSQQSRDRREKFPENQKSFDQAKNLINTFDRRQNENLSKSFDSKKIKTVKKRMKWKDYLAIQVEKQRKINEDLTKTIQDQIKDSPLKMKPKPKEEPKEKPDLKTFEKELNNYKPVQITENFKKFDENEAFFEEIEENETKDDPTKAEAIPEETISAEEADQEEADKRIQEIIQRYEKTIGKIKINSHQSPTPSILSVKIGKSSEKRCKSAYSNYSTETQKVAIEKLKELEEEEKKIQEKKEELLRFLESRSQKRDSSRPVTVSSLMSVASERKKEKIEKVEVAPLLRSYQPVFPTLKLDKPNSRRTSRASKKAEMTSEVKELLSNL